MTRVFGGALPKVLLLVLCLALFVGFFVWKANYGTIGRVAHLTFSTRDYIAYVRTDTGGRSDVYAVKADGSDQKRLTNDGAPKRGVDWSPDGKQLAYALEMSTDGSAAYQIHVLGEGAPRQATYGSASKDQPRWSPDGKAIGYLAGGFIKVMSPNASDTRQVYPPPHKGEGRTEEAPAGQSGGDAGDDLMRPPVTEFQWAANSRSIAALQVTEGENAAALGQGGWWNKSPDQDEGPVQAVSEPESVIVLPNLEGGKPMLMPGANRCSFSWFPDGKRVAVAFSSRRGMHAIIVYRTDERDLPATQWFGAAGLTASAENPRVSPDGTHIAYELWRMDSAENRRQLGIVVQAVDGTPVAIRTKADIAKVAVAIAGDARNPRWSPDGTRLLYMAPRKSGSGDDLWVCGRDGRDRTNLTKGQGTISDPAWSPSR